MASPLEILRKYWGYTTFRPNQEEVISACLNRQDVLAILPTGAGKSICYQVPPLVQEQLGLVISPLIALMLDQVEQLKARGIRAAALYSGMPFREIDYLLDNAVHGGLDFLYVSPERIQTELFRERFQQMDVNIVAIDEAHCISEWGHDFRPAYRQLKLLRELRTELTLLAVTATATPPVAQDITEQLQLRQAVRITGSFRRKNLSLVVRKTEDKDTKLLEILTKTQGSAIVYATTRARTQQIVSLLQKHKISAGFYHGGVATEDRKVIQQRWQSNKLRVVVATNAFGMGINKQDVRLVVHYSLPHSLEAYYQEAGRAGRDGKRAYGVLFFQELDVIIFKKFTQDQFPDAETIKRIYQALANYYKIAIGSSFLHAYDFDLEYFANQYEFATLTVYAAIKRLEDLGLVSLLDQNTYPSKLRFVADKRLLYEYEIANQRSESVIKALLRLYGGMLFSDFQTISENRVAQYCSRSVADVTKTLVSMQDHNMLIYDQRKDMPQLLFTQPRMDVNQLKISQKDLDARKNIHESKWQEVVAYARQETRCRMAWLQDYFGESTAIPCGICDIDLKNKQASSSLSLEEKILEAIHQQALSPEVILNGIKGITREELAQSISNLMEKNLVHYDEYGKLKRL